MGEISNKIKNLKNDEALSPGQIKQMEANIRADYIVKAAPKVGTTVNWPPYSFTLTEPVALENDMVRIVGELYKDGTLVPLSYPLYFMNPPYLVKKDGGEYTVEGPDGPVTLSEDPLQAFLDMLKDFVSQY